MSHISEYGHKVADIEYLQTVCDQLGIELKVGEQLVSTYGGQSEDAVASMHLEGWQYPIAIKKDGTIAYDHWGSDSGSFDRLGEVVMAYNEVAMVAEFWADGEGHNCYDTKLLDGEKLLVFEF